MIINSFLRMNKKDLLISLLLFTIGIASRAPFIERMQSHWDGPQYSIALARGFNFSQETPAPLGYPLYLGLGELFSWILGDPHLSLLTVSVLFSGIAAVVFYVIGRVIFNKIVGLIAAVIFLTGSSFYYFGLTTYGYILIAATTPLLALIVYYIFFKKKRLGLLLGAFYGLVLGFRPQEAIYTLPLFLFGLLLLPLKERIKGGISFLIFFLIWFLPYVVIVGGPQEFLYQTINFAKAGALPPPSLTNIIQRHIILLQGLYLSFGIATILLLYYPYLFFNFVKKNHFLKVLQNKFVLFFSIWILPGLLFNIFVRTEHAGYQMTYLTALLVLIAYAVWMISKKNLRILILIACIIGGINLYIFFVDRDPTYSKPFRQSSLHYSDIRRNDREMETKISFIKSEFNPKTTLILMGPFFWRQTMYHLPEFRILQIDALVTDNPRFADIRRDSLNWTRWEYRTTNFMLKVPDNITTIVVLDEGYRWVKHHEKKIYQLPWNVKITSFPVKPGDTIRYGFHKVEVTRD
jgi:4-amino-4-deoxy-L-arabinose transferase-like glycosyltransferase